ncbi:MAG: HD domain-containing protein [Bacillota bacterium]|nr:HD domain-containing protein [Bacillota bacterium]
MIPEVLTKMILYFKDDARRINHALKVYGFAKAISSGENITNDQKDTLEIAAILHDIGIKEAEKKYNSTAGKYQEIEGPAIAERILEECGIQKTVIERVCYIIGNHHSYNKIDNIDFQVLVEADFLVNIYEDEMDADSIKTIKDKYFKTPTGIKLISSIYNCAFS